MIISLTLGLAAQPLSAQEDKTDMAEGLNLLQQGTRLLLQGLMDEMGPLVLELQGRIIDFSAYYPPEILPNGDIIIRRKPPVEPLPQGETEL